MSGSMQAPWLLGPERWPALPPRSRLYRLAPCAQGTAQGESLSGYLKRLADAHSLQPSVLAWEVIFPDRKRAGLQDLEDRWKYPSFNGIGDGVVAWVDRLEALTMRTGLASLTLGFLGGLVSHRGLVAARPQWCPACFMDDAKDGLPYDRLLWSFAAVTCCPSHGTKLMDRCRCGDGESGGKVNPKGLPNICRRCARDLGEPADRLEPATQEDLRVATLVSALLGGELAQGAPTTGRGLAEFLGDSITANAQGRAAWLGKLLGVGKSTLHGWVHKEHLPDFAQLIKVAETHGCSIEDVLRGRSDAATRSPMVPEAPRLNSNSPRVPRLLGDKELVAALRGILTATPPIHMQGAAKLLGVSTKTLRKTDDALCRQISARWLDAKRTEAALRRVARADQARTVAMKLMASGVLPTFKRVNAAVAGAYGLLGGRELIQVICCEVRAAAGL